MHIHNKANTLEADAALRRLTDGINIGHYINDYGPRYIVIKAIEKNSLSHGNASTERSFSTWDREGSGVASWSWVESRAWDGEGSPKHEGRSEQEERVLTWPGDTEWLPVHKREINPGKLSKGSISSPTVENQYNSCSQLYLFSNRKSTLLLGNSAFEAPSSGLIQSKIRSVFHNEIFPNCEVPGNYAG